MDFRLALDSFVAKDKDIWENELSHADWSAIALMTDWLKSFRSATTQMSATKRATLSFTHAIFRGLQESVRNTLRNLPANSSLKLKHAIMQAHRKLSDYFYKFDESYFCIWSSSEFSVYRSVLPFLIFCLVLDPRITLGGLTEDCKLDSAALAHIEIARLALDQYYQKNYANKTHAASVLSPQPSLTLPSGGSPLKVDFTAQYKRTVIVTNELDEYLNLRPQDFATCDPVKWWAAHASQFPNLSCLAQHILSIPGNGSSLCSTHS